MTRHIVLAALTTSILLMDTGPAMGGGRDHVGPSDGSFEVAVTDEVAAVEGRSGAPAETSAVTVAEPQLPPCGGDQPTGSCEPVTVCQVDATSPTGFSLLTSFGYSSANSDHAVGPPCEPSEAEQAARPSLPSLVLRAFQRVPLPEPQLSIQPPKGKTLVGLETIFSTRAEGFTRNLTLLGRQVQLRIEPSSFTWLHGDDTSQTTDWAGKAWSNDEPDIDGYLTHVYEHTGTVRAGVEVTWSAEYRVGNGPWQTVDGTVTRTSPRAELVVVEGEPVLNAP